MIVVQFFPGNEYRDRPQVRGSVIGLEISITLAWDNPLMIPAASSGMVINWIP